MKSRKLLWVFLAAAMLIQLLSAGIPVSTLAAASASEKQYTIWFDEAADESVEGFERWSLPLGNGYMGINVFGGVETELLSVTENSVFNPGSSGNGTLDSDTGIFYNDFGDERIDNSSGGLNLMAKTYIDFTGHTTDGASNYKRELSINDSVAKVSYDYDGVTYTREYFSSYPDKVTVMRLSASVAGKLSFTLRPEIPFCYDPEVDATKYSYLNQEGDGYYKTGKVTAEGDTITLKGTMAYLGTDFEGLYKVIPTGGSMVAANDANGKNGTITVTDADSVIIILAAGTNYDYEYITFDKAKGMLDDAPDPHEKVQGWLDAAAAKTYDALLGDHQADFKTYYDRASLDLGGVFDDSVTTDLLVSSYGTGNTANDRYLEEMTFQYGRYLLIASSREGCLPANLQGIWNFADSAAWSGGYWHNINIQMNYWLAFNTGLSELFQSYVDYNVAMRDKAQTNADSYLKSISAPGIATAGTGENGYTIGTGCNPYFIASPYANGHSGPGTVAFTSLLFWDWYEFTQDETVLSEYVYPAVEGAAKFLSKTVKQYEDGTYLVYKSASPENGISNVYIRTVGSAFDQQMVYANHLATLEAAEILGYTEEDYPILATINEQINKLDPVKIGYSGQVKEYREENYYGEYGEKFHRHISQLVGVYPADLINGDTDAWLDAAGVSLENRGYTNIAWGVIHRMLCWARIQDGEQAFDELELMMTEHLGYSLLSNYNSLKRPDRKHNNPFQIEANFGYTAAVAEMLVQSQAGYIEFLPALPEAWSTGSFQGLTARGDFAVDAAWTDGVATEFKIYSGSGKECAVKYPNIASAVVKDSAGNTVSFTAEGEDLITFATTKGETYTISAIPSHTPNLAAPTGLSLEAGDAKMDLSWTASEGAASYNVYRALNDEPSYTLVGEGVTGTSYTYNYSDIQGYDRVTMRVTAVAADGTESTSALVYALPVTALEEVTGYMFEDNVLQLEYAASDNATEYRVYADGDLVATSAYTVAVVKNADPTATYTVSAVADGRESAATQATVYHAAEQDNIMLHKPMTLEGRPYWIDMDKTAGTKYDGALAVNGNTATNNSQDRWAVTDSMEPFSVTADLQGIYKLGTIKIYEWGNNTYRKTRSNNTKVEVLTPNGEWVTVKEGFSLAWRAATPVDAEGVLASKIRFTFQNTKDNYSACIAEITCTGEKIDAVNKIDLLEALQSYGGQDVTASDFAGVPVAYILAEPEALKVLADTTADQHTVDKAARALTKAATGSNIFLNRTVEVNLKEINNYPATLMVDGITDSNYKSRWAVSEGSNAGTTENTAVVTITLDGLHHLEGVFVQEFLQADSGVERKTNGGDVTIEVSADGSNWNTVLSGVSLRENRDKIPYANCSNTAFVLDNSVLASQVRLTIVDSVGTANKAISVHEIQAYGEKVDESGLYLSSNLLTLDSGKTHTLTPSVAGVTWASSDPDVVSVDSTGKLTAYNRGSAVITATDGTNTVSCEVSVLCDTSALEEAIAEAKTALDGIQGIDRTADRVISGVKFVPTAQLTALTNAIATAEAALPDATSAALVRSAAAALSTELDAFNATLTTGTMDITNHSHCVCTGVQDHDCTAVTWTAWGDDENEKDTLPAASGNYFLVGDLSPSGTPTSGHVIETGKTVNLCLNGFNITTEGRTFNIRGTLSICDCLGTGVVTGNAENKNTGVGGVVIVRAAEGAENTFNLYGGTLVQAAEYTNSHGGVINIQPGNGSTHATVNVYGGTISSGKSTGTGGNVIVGRYGIFRMYGGSSVGGRSTQDGGNVYIGEYASFYLIGGTVSGGESDAKGDCIAVASNGKLEITGGTVSGTAEKVAIYTNSKGTVQISGGTFTDGLSVEGTTIADVLAADCILTKTGSYLPLILADDATTSGTESVTVTGAPIKAESLKFSAASVTLYNDLAVNFKVGNALLAEGGYTDPFVVFQFGGQKTVEEAEVIDASGRAVICFRDIAPHMIGDTITATLYATKDGVLYIGDTVEYSVKQYCYNMLSTYNDVDYPSAAYGELRTLLVDLLNYGAAAQQYTGYNTDALVNAQLVDKQLDWATAEDPAVSKDAVAESSDLDAPAVKWAASGLVLDEAVTVRLGFTAESTEGLCVKFTLAGRIYEVTEFKAMTDKENGWYVYFDELNAAQMRDVITATVYQNGQQVSNTASYNVEAYVASHASDGDALGSLVKALIRYGDAAEAFAN